MKIFIPTIDDQSPYAELIYKIYNKIYWDKNYLDYYIPYKEKQKMISYNFFAKQNNVKLIRAAKNLDITRVILELLRFADDDEWIFWAPHNHYPSPFPNIKDKNFLHNVYNYIIKSNPDLDVIYLDPSQKDGKRSAHINKSRKFFIDKGQFNKELIGIKFDYSRHCFAKAYYIKKIFLTTLDEKYHTKSIKESLDIKKSKFNIYTLTNDRIFYEKIWMQKNGLMCRNVGIALWDYSCKKPKYIFDFSKDYNF
jgi:hypothetical protein